MKSILLFTALIFSTVSLNAQLFAKAGIVNSHLNEKATANLMERYYDGELSYTVSGGYRISILQSFAVEAGVAYTKLRYEDVQVKSNSLDQVYFMLPIQAKFKLNMLELGIGAAPAVLASYDKAVELIYENKYDVTGLLTLAVFPLEGIGLELGYHYGFVPISELEVTDVNGNSIENLILKNRYYSLSAVIRI